MLSRRLFMAGAAAGILAAPGLVGAQQRRVKRVAMISPLRPESELNEAGTSFYGVFFRELRRLGWVEGSTMQIERLAAGAQAEPLDYLARRAISSRPDLIFSTVAETQTLFALMISARFTPIVAPLSDPVASLVADSLTRPTSNVTGASIDDGVEVGARQIRLLHDAVPTMRRLGFLVRALTEESPTMKRALGEAQARGLGVVVAPVEAPVEPGTIERALAKLGPDAVDGIVIGSSFEFVTLADMIAARTRALRLPTIGWFAEQGKAGLMMTYGPSLDEIWSRLARYVDNVLRGSDPTRLPIEQPSRFDLHLNLKTAREIGLSLPAATLALANQLIE